MIIERTRAALAAFPLLCCAAIPAAHANDVIVVHLDQAKVMDLPDKTSTVIVGNPIVADVTMLKRNNKVVLTGKGYGETNLIALDSAGNSLGESLVRVSGGFDGVIVQRGMDRQSLHCSPRCQPTVNLGDSTSYIADAAAQIQQHNAISQPGGGGK